ncbi:unnamed protein product, partial [Mesorhabditis belari]|uniref:RRM domain-containing protein n=1 Tax=Mesorhabditis belari TaxID=2138241 RepID=A0AAF3JA90_9BILA
MKEIERGQLRRFRPKIAKKRRKRTRTGNLRHQVIEEIEKALSIDPSPVGHLFNKVDLDGTPEASFLDVLNCLSLPSTSVLAMPSAAILSINRQTTMFELVNDTDTWLIRHRPVRAHPYDCMVYLDNLPETVTRERLLRELRKFGTVVQIRLPHRQRKPANQNGYSQPKRLRGFAFAQFSDPNAVQKFSYAYHHNLPMAIRKRNLLRLLFCKQRRSKRRKTLNEGNNLAPRNVAKNSEKENCLTLKVRTSTDEVKIEGKPNGSLHLELTSPTVPVVDLLSPESGERGRLMSTSTIASDFLDRARCSLDVIRASIDEGSGPRKKRRRRKRHFMNIKQLQDPQMKTKDPSHIDGSVYKFFRRIQVIPFRIYRQLRTEYTTQMRKARVGTPYELKDLQQCVAFRDKHWSIDNADDSDGMESGGEGHREE